MILIFLKIKMGRKCITRGFKLKNMSSEGTKVFSLLFAFQGKPRKMLGYKKDKAGLKLKAECI